jgi:hypothetical protein
MNSDELSALSRRELLAGAATIGLSAELLFRAGSAAAAEQGDLDPITLQRKLRYRTDSGLVFWWLRGIKYAQEGTKLTPLFTNHTGTIQRVRQRDDGGFDVTLIEVTLQTAVDSDTPLTSWTNPLTGEQIPIQARPLGPTTISYRPDNSRVLPKELGGARLESESHEHDPVIVGDDVFAAQVVKAKVFRPERESPYVVNDLSHHHGSLAELRDPTVTMAHATVSFAEATGWQSWMNMGERPGTLTSRTFGAKVGAFEAMPAVWRAALERMAPEIAADPVAALDAPAATFDR